ncbi:hypothetical protein D3C73_1123750 [compost metagenome]
MCFKACRQIGQLLLRIVQRFAHFHLRVEQPEQQAVAVGQIIFFLGVDRIFQQRHAVQAQLGRHRRRLAHMVGLDCTGGNQRIGSLPQRIGGQKLKLSQFVTAQRHWRDVVTFDVNFTAKVV